MFLSALAIQNARPRQKPYKLADGDGLHLLVQPNGKKLWRLRYRFAGKENMLVLGPLAAVSLASARSKREAARKLLAEGVEAAGADRPHAHRAMAAGRLSPAVPRSLTCDGPARQDHRPQRPAAHLLQGWPRADDAERYGLDARLRGRALSVLAGMTSFIPTACTIGVRLSSPAFRLSGGLNIGARMAWAFRPIRRTRIRRSGCSRCTPLTMYSRESWARPCGPGSSRLAPRAPSDPERGKPGLGLRSRSHRAPFWCPRRGQSLIAGAGSTPISGFQCPGMACRWTDVGY